MTSQAKPRLARGGGGNIKQFTVFCCLGPVELGLVDDTPEKLAFNTLHNQGVCGQTIFPNVL